MPEDQPYLATADIPFHGVLAFTEGQQVPDTWVDAHPDETEGRVKRRTPPVVEQKYDPASHNQDEVLAHLAAADPAEVERVQAAEAAGKNRKQIADFGQES